MTLTLSAPGERKNIVSIEEATAVVARWKQEVDDACIVTITPNGNGTTTFTTVVPNITIVLSCRVWHLNRLQVLQPILQSILPVISNLQLSDITATLQTQEGLAVVRSLGAIFQATPQLRTVNLADTTLGTRGMVALQPLLQNSNVVSWNLHNTGIAADDALTMESLWSNSKAIETLALGRNQIGLDGISHIARLIQSLSNLKEFSYNYCSPLVAGTLQLCDGLCSLPHPENMLKLDLSGCDFSPREDEENGIEPLCQFLKRAIDLKHLFLSDCELQFEGLGAVLAALQTSQAALESLALGGNGEQGVEGATALRDFFLQPDHPAAKTITLLDFSTNELGDDGVEILAEGLAPANAFPNLKTLKLDCNEIKTAGAVALVRHRIPTLQTLTLLDNMDFPAGAARRLRAMYDALEVEEDLAEEDDYNAAFHAELVALREQFANSFVTYVKRLNRTNRTD